MNAPELAPASSQADTRERIAVIDGLRGWAALGVVAAHVFAIPYRHVWYYPWITVGGYHLSPLGFLLNLHQAVTLFFVLSGFVLTYPYLAGTRKMEHAGDVWTFVMRRSRRLLPLYLTAILWFATFGGAVESPGTTLKNVLMLGTGTFHFFHPLSATPYDGVLWSLEVEWWCSLTLPFFLFALRRWSMERILMTAIAFSMLCRLAFLWNTVDGDGLTAYLAVSNMPTRIDAFVLGMGMAFLFARHPRLASARSGLLLLGSIVFLSTGFVIFELIVGQEAPVILFALSCPLITVGWAMFLLWCLVAWNPFIRYALCTRPIRLVGRMCYSVYVWHYPAIVVLQPMLNIWRFLRYAGLLSAVSFISYRYLEFRHVQNVRDLLPQAVRSKHGDPRSPPLLQAER